MIPKMMFRLLMAISYLGISQLGGRLHDRNGNDRRYPR